MARNTVVKVRVGAEDFERLDEVSRRTKVARSSLVQRAFESGVRRVLVDDAVGRYQRGETSAWFAARRAGINLWQMLDEMKARGVPFRTDEDLLERQVAELRRGRLGRLRSRRS
jgi:predicted DNA-binding protein